MSETGLIIIGPGYQHLRKYPPINPLFLTLIMLLRRTEKRIKRKLTVMWWKKPSKQC